MIRRDFCQEHATIPSGSGRTGSARHARIRAARRRGFNWTDISGIEGGLFAEPNSNQARMTGSCVYLGSCPQIARAYLLDSNRRGQRKYMKEW